MPVTAKLSKRFYARLGEDVANELVDWFNQVDATYRSDLREINENNFARFDAKVEQRFAESEARWAKRFGEFEALETKQFADLRVELIDRLSAQSRQLTRLMVALWAALLIPIIGLWTR